MEQARLVARTPVRQHLTYEQKIEVIDFYRQYESALTLEAMVPLLREMGYLTICATTIRRCVDNEQKIRNYIARNPSGLQAKQEVIVTHPQVEFALVRWIDHKLNNNVRLQGDFLIEKAHELCNILGIPLENRIGFSKGWLRRFKHCHGLHRVRFHGERASAPVAYILAERRRLQPILALYAPWNRFNMDETALFFRQSLATGLAKYESGGIKHDKRRLTYALCSNQDGSYKLPPLIIGHADHP
ncbi:hypothetical protein RSOLAG1IB_10894 [Rhizoctonia solani AG-1 IB]|uniref:HTH CENPB-type domain-containing protein n=1 Tax=Thanatephorus cucumeris (strain AG1-IB / isolate 7/3/14) TaxID=1108050 RepID=A0A0B7G0A5_THACB|nr:hypothetical protein RSOLAG1IB_10894 [Rhizoctonia solani AG-1 IB]